MDENLEVSRVTPALKLWTLDEMFPSFIWSWRSTNRWMQACELMEVLMEVLLTLVSLVGLLH